MGIQNLCGRKGPGHGRQIVSMSRLHNLIIEDGTYHERGSRIDSQTGRFCIEYRSDANPNGVFHVTGDLFDHPQSIGRCHGDFYGRDSASLNGFSHFHELLRVAHPDDGDSPLRDQIFYNLRTGHYFTLTLICKSCFPRGNMGKELIKFGDQPRFIFD